MGSALYIQEVSSSTEPSALLLRIVDTLQDLSAVPAIASNTGNGHLC